MTQYIHNVTVLNMKEAMKPIMSQTWGHFDLMDTGIAPVCTW